MSLEYSHVLVKFYVVFRYWNILYRTILYMICQYYSPRFLNLLRCLSISNIQKLFDENLKI